MTPQTRALIIPAAGAGSRLGAALPKALVSVGGQPMLRRLLDIYAPWVSTAVVVVSPSAVNSVGAVVDERVRLAVQAQPTGMLDAIQAGASVLPDVPDWIWITWCDQILVRRDTLATLAAITLAHPDAALAMPTVRTPDPYIHFDRSDDGTIVQVLQKREGDRMPCVGESDMGLFGLSAEAWTDLLPQYAAEAAVPSTVTGERNFLPFIPWVAARGQVVTFPATDPNEALGVNTPADLARAERYLQERG